MVWSYHSMITTIPDSSCRAFVLLGGTTAVRFRPLWVAAPFAFFWGGVSALGLASAVLTAQPLDLGQNVSVRKKGELDPDIHGPQKLRF